MQDEYSITVAESFFNIGSGERLALVRARVEELLAAEEQPLQPASRPQGGGRAALQPVQGNRLQQPGGRALQPAKAQHKQRQQQVAQADSVEAAVGRENAFLAAPRGQLAGGKRKASNSQASINQARAVAGLKFGLPPAAAVACAVLCCLQGLHTALTQLRLNLAAGSAAAGRRPCQQRALDGAGAAAAGGRRRRRRAPHLPLLQPQAGGPLPWRHQARRWGAPRGMLQPTQSCGGHT